MTALSVRKKREERKKKKKKSDLITLENIYLRVQGVKVKAGNVFKLRWMFTTDSLEERFAAP